MSAAGGPGRLAEFFFLRPTFGILLTIGFQALINMTVVTGLAPTKGIALPLISAGGTGWVLTAFCVGLLVALDKTLQREKTPGVFFRGGRTHQVS